ncbi:T9SS type A sorting domain-containing protein [Flavobacterium lindanitolerans]|uniref:Secreted protein (Por secretion system target) n=1 Tax=Flavobacterium lindanitolerans TaxID=428988 RepID=A0A497U975_9FLAO|nr:T9SS type A sorting domain-containing protein [Flavobacterium lindanitolerans]PKW29926.1 putative secreted protein (Por secretion system target) [Flavobacterium lindanitolerans]RLJ24266.1 putative secreted protein (Por secretion system target) [Flavobacterium lindanitolerans]
MKVLSLFFFLGNSVSLYSQLNYTPPLMDSSDSNWELIFEDNFDYINISQLETSQKWSLYNGFDPYTPNGTLNNIQAFTGYAGHRYLQKKNIEFANGIMTLKFKREDINVYPPQSNSFSQAKTILHYYGYYPCSVGNGYPNPCTGNNEQERLLNFKQRLKENVKWHGLNFTEAQIDAITVDEVNNFPSATNSYLSPEGETPTSPKISNLKWMYTGPSKFISNQKFRFGYFEIKCRVKKPLPQYNYRGIGATFWLFSRSNQNGCPGTTYSEIDIFEFHNRKYSYPLSAQTNSDFFQSPEHRYKSNLYYGASNNQIIDNEEQFVMSSENEAYPVNNISGNDDFNIYGCYWSGNEIAFYKNNVLVRKATRHDIMQGNNKLDFLHDLKPMQILFDIGAFIYNEEPDANTMDYDYEIDYIKVYKPKFLHNDTSIVHQQDSSCDFYPYWQEKGFKELNNNPGELCNNSALNDKTIVCDINSDGYDDLVIVNSEYCQSAWSLKVIDVKTKNNLYSIPTGIIDGWVDEEDKIFFSDLNGDGIKELILLNLSTTGSSRPDLLVFNLVTNNFLSYLSPKEFGAGLMDFFDADDLISIGDTNSDGREDLIFFNKTNIGTAYKVIDIMTGNTLLEKSHGIYPNNNYYEGWVDPGDKVLVGDTNGDGQKEVILINTDYQGGGAISVIDLATGNTLFATNHSTTLNANNNFSGFMDVSDRIIIANVDQIGGDDLVLINTSGIGDAIRCIRLSDDVGGIKGSRIFPDIASTTFDGWLDTCDKISIKDVTGDQKLEMVLLNTSTNAIYAINVIDLFNNARSTFCASYSSANLGCNSNASGTFDGWLDPNDRSLIGKFKNDKSDLLLINMSYTGDALRALDLRNGSSYGVQPHDGRFMGWLDGIDENINCPEDIYQSRKKIFSTPQYNLTIYPNPVNNIVNIGSETLINKIKIYTMDGKTVYSKEFQVGQKHFELDIIELKSGIYFLNMQTIKGEILSKKIIKQ